MDEALPRTLIPTVIGILVRRGAGFTAAGSAGAERLPRDGDELTTGGPVAQFLPCRRSPEVSTPPRERRESRDQRDREDSTDMALRELPIDRTEPKDPMLAMEALDPMLPMEMTEPFEAMDSRESSDHSDHFDPCFLVLMGPCSSTRCRGGKDVSRS